MDNLFKKEKRKKKKIETLITRPNSARQGPSHASPPLISPPLLT